MKHLVKLAIWLCGLYLRFDKACEREMYQLVTGETLPEDWYGQ